MLRGLKRSEAPLDGAHLAAVNLGVLRLRRICGSLGWSGARACLGGDALCGRPGGRNGGCGCGGGGGSNSRALHGDARHCSTLRVGVNAHRLQSSGSDHSPSSLRSISR